MRERERTKREKGGGGNISSAQCDFETGVPDSGVVRLLCIVSLENIDITWTGKENRTLLWVQKDLKTPPNKTKPRKNRDNSD